MPTWNKLSFPDANSPQMEQILFFHDHILMILTLVLVFVLFMTLSIWKNRFYDKLLLEAQSAESFWTLLPILLIVMISFPSLKILYMMEEAPSPDLSVKVTGHQWFWVYETGKFLKLAMYLKKIPKKKKFRLLDTNKRLILPTSSPSQLLITSADVIHSWTIPTLGVKTDATPGRINQITLLPLRPGVFFGQCSEICGVNHSFMPITVEIIPFMKFINWLKS